MIVTNILVVVTTPIDFPALRAISIIEFTLLFWIVSQFSSLDFTAALTPGEKSIHNQNTKPETSIKRIFIAKILTYHFIITFYSAKIT